MLIKAMLVDDEQPSLNKLEKLLCDSGLAEVVAKFTEPIKALEFIQDNRVDLVFLDIEMPDMDGIELACRILDRYERTDIVFVTAYNQYAVEAFRLHALDYLLKPVAFDRLEDTLNRINKSREASKPSGILKVQCFGKFCVSVGTEEIKFRTEKAEELLALLLDSRGGFISRSKIIDTLWEDFDGDRAIIHFNTTLHYIKKALLPYGIKLSIIYDRGSYKLDVDAVDCDYLRFCDFTGRTDAVNNPPTDISEHENIASLYTGEYLSGRDYDWAAGRRLWLLEQYINLLFVIENYYIKLGNYSMVIKWLKEGLLLEPLHRELNYRLVKVLLHTHERILAHKHYELYRKGLAKKLGIEPDKEFKRLLS